MTALIGLLILLLIFAAVFYVLTLIPLPPPFLRLAQIIAGILLLLALLDLLTGGGLTSGPWFNRSIRP